MNDPTKHPLLNLIIGQCGTHFIFGHRNPSDCEFFAKITSFQSIDLKRRKHTVRTLQQTTVGHDIINLYSEAANWSDAQQTGGSAGSGTTRTQTNTIQTGTTSTNSVQTNDIDALRRAVTEARGDQRSSSQGDAVGTSITDTSSWSSTSSRGGSRTRSQALVPRLLTQVIEHPTFMEVDEQLIESATRINRFGPGECIINRPGKGAVIVKLPMVRNRYFRTPEYGRGQLEQFYAAVYTRPEYESLPQLIARQENFERALIERIEHAFDETTDDRTPGQEFQDFAANENDPFSM